MFTASNGEIALKEITCRSKDYFTAVILDLNMPVMDGYEACDRINDLLNGSENMLPAQQLVCPRSQRKSRTLLFCLSADVSDETYQMIKLHPFDEVLESLAPD